MADCYYHGYSGGPGGCSICDAEETAGEEPGTRDGYDQSITCADWKNGGPDAAKGIYHRDR